jgi:hypothetical protein
MNAALADHVIAGSKLHADDTPVPVLCLGRKTTKQGRLWTYVRDDRASADTTPAGVWFVYTTGRKKARCLIQRRKSTCPDRTPTSIWTWRQALDESMDSDRARHSTHFAHL